MWAPVDGLDVYYEIHGGQLDASQPPLLMIPGGLMSIETGFTPDLIARFARRQPVIAMEQQGHGHTADRPDKPITIDRMVADAHGVLAHLGVLRADLLGHSLGGMTATGVAIRHPEIVRNLITLGAPFELDGFIPDLARLQRDPTFVPPPELIPLLPTEAEFAAWRASFARSAPDPEAFDAITERFNIMLGTWPGWTRDDLSRISARTLIVIGDNDYVRVDHAATISRTITNARLAVFPGTTHFGVVKRDDWLDAMLDSLSAPAL